VKKVSQANLAPQVNLVQEAFKENLVNVENEAYKAFKESKDHKAPEDYKESLVNAVNVV
jgi:hypothetical protein